MRIKHLRLTLPARLRHSAQFDARQIADAIAGGLHRQSGLPSNLRIELNGQGRHAPGLADAVGTQLNHQVRQSTMPTSGKRALSMAVATKGVLFEYGLSIPPLALVFDFNPQEISRSRTITIKTGNAPGSRGGYDFLSPLETSRVAQGVEMQAESFSISILLDATDGMNEGETIASRFGVQPQIDTLRSMVEPKAKGPVGVQMLASLGGGAQAFERDETASVLIFAWGLQFLPVFLTGVTQKESLHLPNLLPYRAEMSLTMQVIESANPFYLADKVRQTAMTALNAVSGF